MWFADNLHAGFPVDAVDPFFNVNTPEDLKRAEALLSRVRFTLWRPSP